MDEIQKIFNKYESKDLPLPDETSTLNEIRNFSLIFFKDVAETYDCITRIKNVERNPSGYSLSDAPIIGLLVKTWKLLKETIRYFEENNAEIISILERSLIESSIIASYLLKNDDSVIEDYRKCSYKNRLRILRDSENGSAFYESKPGKRLLNSVKKKMKLENLNANDFSSQKKNRWKLQGKTFYDIFKEVSDENLYHSTYGMMSESIHGSWNDSMDFCLQRNKDNTFSIFPFYQEADIRFLAPIFFFCNPPYQLWIKRIEADDDNLCFLLNWIEKVNIKIFRLFDEKFNG